MSILAVIIYDDGSFEQLQFEDHKSNALDILRAYADSNGYQLITENQQVAYECYPLTNSRGGSKLYGTAAVEYASGGESHRLVIETSAADMAHLDPSGGSLADYCEFDAATILEVFR